MEKGNYGTTNYRNPIKMCDWNHFFSAFNKFLATMSRTNITYSRQKDDLSNHTKFHCVNCSNSELQLNVSNEMPSLLNYFPFVACFEWNSFVELMLSEIQNNLLHCVVHFTIRRFLQHTKKHLFRSTRWEIHLPTSNFPNAMFDFSFSLLTTCEVTVGKLTLNEIVSFVELILNS